MGLFDIFKSKNKKQYTNWTDAQYIDDPIEKEKALIQIEKHNIDDPIGLHFTYNQLIELYYKQRDKWDNALEKCIDTCWKDINKMDDIIREFKKDQLYKDYGSLPRMPSFQRLAIIYEKQGKIEEAITVCDKAITYKLTDKTKGGFEGRKKKLEKKLKGD